MVTFTKTAQPKCTRVYVRVEVAAIATDLSIGRFVVDTELGWFGRALESRHLAVFTDLTPCVGLNGAGEMQIGWLTSAHH